MEGSIITLVMAGLVPVIHVLLAAAVKRKTWMPGTSPRLSGSIFMDRVHDVDSSVF